MSLFKMLKNRSREKQKREAQTAENVRLMFETEFCTFREVTLNKTKEEIFELAGRIRFYQNIYDYVQDEDAFDYETAEKIYTITPIAELWDSYLSSDFLTVDCYEDIEQLFDETFSHQKGGICYRLNVGEKTTDHCLYA